MPNGIVVITGPTATGKTALGVELAHLHGGEVVSADSMQLYRGMDIGTATPDEAEMRGVPHHLLSYVDPREENYSVSRYVEDASRCVDDILARGKLPVVVGGTGLYIDALIRGVSFTQFDGQIRRQCEELYDQAPALAYAQLLRADPEAARRIHPNDRKRVVRALEVFRATGRPISEHDRETREKPPRYRACKIALSFASRQTLYARIDARVDRMLEQGLVEEVRGLLGERGVPPESTAMQAIGYKELADALAGRTSLDEAVAQIKQSSRRYAKRQLSWLRRDPDNHWIMWDETPNYQTACLISTTFMENSGIIESARQTKNDLPTET